GGQRFLECRAPPSLPHLRSSQRTRAVYDSPARSLHTVSNIRRRAVRKRRTRPATSPLPSYASLVPLLRDHLKGPSSPSRPGLNSLYHNLASAWAAEVWEDQWPLGNSAPKQDCRPALVG